MAVDAPPPPPAIARAEGEAAPTPTRPTVSVVVPHYGDPAPLDRCLAALVAQSWPHADYEIVVADNGSPQGQEAIAAIVAGRARLVMATERGAGPARNAGVAASQGAILAFTDSDCIPEADWLAEGVKALGAHDFIGGRMVVTLESDGPKSGAEAFEQVFAFDNEDYVRRKGFTVTANLFCPRALFDKVGGFCTGMSEDLEWCLRARAAGYHIGYAPDAVVGHPARRDWPALIGKWRRINAETYTLSSGTVRGRLAWLARAWLMPVSIVAHAPRVFASDRLADGRERMAALGTLARLRLWRFADAHWLLFGER